MMANGGALTRSSGGRSAKDYTIIIAYDGEKTEDDYFRGWKLIIPPSRLTLEPIFVRSGGNALKAVERAAKKKKSYTDFAEFWCVCDVDNTSAGDLHNAQQLATANDIRLCLSNRCFEIWLALHYSYSTQAIGCEEDAIELVKRHINSYSSRNKTIPFHNLYSKTEEAIARAEKLVAAGFENPFTSMHHLARKLFQNTV
jgi:hypothetical protein